MYSRAQGIWSERRSDVANIAPSLVTEISSRNSPIGLQLDTGGTTLDYNKRESTPDSRYMHAFLGQDARLPNWEILGVDTTVHLILGPNRASN
jgi:hypothetical protein